MPDGAVYVGRPTKFGNPWTVDDYFRVGYSGNGFDALRIVVDVFRAWVTGTDQRWLQLYIEQMGRPNREPPNIEALRGKDLTCWCPLHQSCHADVLLELANQ